MTTHALFQMFTSRRALLQSLPEEDSFPATAPDAAGGLQSRSDDDELARLKRALWQSQREARLGRLLAGVAHDMNNPLTVILGRAEMLAEDAAHAAGVRSGAQRIADAARRCASLVTGVLGLAGKGRGGAPRAAEVVQGLVPLLAQPLQKEGVRLQVALDATLPPIGGDASELAHALLALLDNARQALAEVPADARQIVIRSGQDADRAGWQWLSVADSGPGVPEALAAQVFEPFFSTRRDAAGLGLTMAREAVRAMGGELELVPGGAGACFRMRWPTAQ